ncbi:cell wall-associated NlpC family hydrolase [Spinactinospora alkalitolerans]|uniref:Cell wall-associated NlpC family hydrolase n=1 Tax=Spinactinospora alkalitolerans TaxID=687207 RepID=A0A852U1N5_9ACTN|nr:NlpC/P60 family protein [Spinactinospora alkalitolerans]NYE49497.1 cell wall-associated NlpC family hydrolase [Spinactinospora alkalitolerans]
MTDNGNARKRVITGFGVLAASSLVLPAGVAHAEPEPTKEEVEQRIEELTEESSTLVQEYNQAKENLEAAEKRIESLEEEVGDEEDLYEGLRDQVARFAAAAYKSADLDSTTTVLSVEDPEDILNQSADLSYLSENQRTQLEEFAGSSERLIRLKQEAEDARDEAQEQTGDLEEQKEEVEDKLAEQEELLAGFEGENPTAGAASDSGGGSYTGSVSGSARAALDFAYSKIGTPYVWGGTGPNGYDCSGLMQAAWGSAGVSIPRTTYAQYELPKKVSRADLQPGDIMFFFEDLGHNGMYAGNGQMVHAPSSGKTVSVVDLADYWDQHFVGAVRP